jgi:hypothetical protein
MRGAAAVGLLNVILSAIAIKYVVGSIIVEWEKAANLSKPCQEELLDCLVHFFATNFALPAGIIVHILFLPLFIALIGLVGVEASRGSTANWTSALWAVFIAALSQLIGVAVVFPGIWMSFYLIKSRKRGNSNDASAWKLNGGKAWANFLGIMIALLPVFGMLVFAQYSQFKDLEKFLDSAALFQFAPLIPGVLILLVPRGSKNEESVRYTKIPLGFHCMVFVIAFVGFVLHFYLFYLLNNDIKILDSLAGFSLNQDASRLSQLFLWCDFAIILVSVTSFLLYENQIYSFGVLNFFIAAILFSPGAAFAWILLKREKEIVRKLSSRKDD